LVGFERAGMESDAEEEEAGEEGKGTSACEELRRRWRRLADCRMQEEIFSVARALSAVLPCVSAGTPAILNSRGLTADDVSASASSNHPGSSALGRFILFSSLVTLFLFSPLSLSLRLSLWLSSLVPFLHPFRCYCCCMIASEEPASMPTTLHVTLAIPPPQTTCATSLSTSSVSRPPPATSSVLGPPSQVPPTSPLQSRPGWTSEIPPYRPPSPSHHSHTTSSFFEALQRIFIVFIEGGCFSA
jgi:hypothetical protein